MSRAHVSTRRGLTLLELMLALSVTAMVGAGIAGMLGVVSSGVSTHRDTRSVMIRAHAAQSRLGAYIGRGRCVLDESDDGEDLVLWLEDSRSSDTVHASEIRWLLYDTTAGAIDVFFVRFPEAWTQTACDLADLEYPAGSNWSTVLSTYEAAGHLGTIRLIDGVSAVSVNLDAVDPLDAQTVTFLLDFETEEGAERVPVCTAIRHHQEPTTP